MPNIFSSKQKIKFVIISIIIFICVSLIAVFIKSYFFAPPNENAQNSSQVSDYSYEYIMKATDGKIGIYKDDVLIDTLNVYVENLPEDEVTRLNHGLLVKDKAELDALIEAFDS